MTTNKQQYLELLEESLMTVLVAFADDSKLGITCLQMMTLPDTALYYSVSDNIVRTKG